jgi:hypothetical protein
VVVARGPALTATSIRSHIVFENRQRQSTSVIAVPSTARHFSMTWDLSLPVPLNFIVIKRIPPTRSMGTPF